MVEEPRAVLSPSSSQRHSRLPPIRSTRELPASVPFRRCGIAMLSGPTSGRPIGDEPLARTSPGRRSGVIEMPLLQTAGAGGRRAWVYAEKHPEHALYRVDPSHFCGHINSVIRTQFLKTPSKYRPQYKPKPARADKDGRYSCVRQWIIASKAIPAMGPDRAGLAKEAVSGSVGEEANTC